MADISQIEVSNTTYDIKDINARRLATASTVGRVMPDNVSIVVNENGMISAIGSAGSNIYVSTTDDDLIGATVTITDGFFTATGEMSNSKSVTFPRFLGTGWLTISATVGAATAYTYIYCPSYASYRTTLEFFSATVNVSTSETDLFDGGHAYVTSEVAPDEVLTFDSTGHTTYTAHVPGLYTFYII